jgi:spore coat protein U-like protein
MTARKVLILILASVVSVCCMSRPAAAVIACTISMTNVAFGSIDVLPGSAIDTTSTATITCSSATANTTYRFCTDIRSGADVSGNQRRMASGVNRLNFDLYKDAARTVQWGHYTTIFLGGGSQNDFTSNGAGNISATITVFARLAGSQQTAIPGAYSESMTGNNTNDLQYGSLASAGSCPIGGSTSQYSFTVSATVNTSCNVNATTHNFGSAGLLTSNVDATSTVTAQCTNTTPYNIGLNAGTGSGATVATRKMTSGGATINYSLHTNSADHRLGQHDRDQYRFRHRLGQRPERHRVRARAIANDSRAGYLYRHDCCHGHLLTTESSHDVPTHC